MVNLGSRCMCPSCGKAFSEEFYMNEHWRIEHGGRREDQNDY